MLTQYYIVIELFLSSPLYVKYMSRTKLLSQAENCQLVRGPTEEPIHKNMTLQNKTGRRASKIKMAKYLFSVSSLVTGHGCPEFGIYKGKIRKLYSSGLYHVF